MVPVLVEGGADPDRRGPDGNTALMTAARYGYHDTVVYLKERGADAGAANRFGKTAAMLARESRYDAIADYLEKTAKEGR